MPSGQRQSLAAGASGGLVVLLCLLTCFICRVWRRNRYYSKVQRTLDEEERAFQETLARNYSEAGVELDGDDRAKLDMLESYMAGVGGEAAAGGEAGEESPAPMPTKVEDVDKFMQDLAAAAQGRRPPDDEAEAVEGEKSARI